MPYHKLDYGEDQQPKLNGHLVTLGAGILEARAAPLYEGEPPHLRGKANGSTPPEPKEPELIGPLLNTHAVCRKWFGPDYDLEVVDATLVVAAIEQLDGDPTWLMHLSPPGSGKTATINNVRGYSTKEAPVVEASNIASPGAFISATKPKDKNTKHTGGILRELGARGILLIKDFTTIMSLSRDSRSEVIAVFREVYDGSYIRKTGNEGGQTFSWEGRIVVIAACTASAWDPAHSAIAEMGPRFLCIRNNPTNPIGAAHQALDNLGNEAEMHRELEKAFREVLSNVNLRLAITTEADEKRLIEAANAVAIARTPVQRDPYKGDIIATPYPEVPTRLAKQLMQVVRGGLAIGMSKKSAMALAMRLARDSIPPLRVTIIKDILDNNGEASAKRTAKRLNWSSQSAVTREYEAMRMLGIIWMVGAGIEYGVDGALRAMFSQSPMKRG